MLARLRKALAAIVEHVREKRAEWRFAQDVAKLERDAMADTVTDEDCEDDDIRTVADLLARSDDVCGPHFGVLTCTCKSPVSEPELWRDPGCPVHSRDGEAN